MLVGFKSTRSIPTIRRGHGRSSARGIIGQYRWILFITSDVNPL